MSSKYDPLGNHLSKLRIDKWRASFEDIEDILGFRLPFSAYKHSAWWANEKHPKTHVQKKVWQSAGWGTEGLNKEARTVTFIRR